MGQTAGHTKLTYARMDNTRHSSPLESNIFISVNAQFSG